MPLPPDRIGSTTTTDRQGSTTPRRETEENQTAHVIAFMRTRRGAPAAGPQDPRRAAQVNNVQRPGATRPPVVVINRRHVPTNLAAKLASPPGHSPSLPRRLRSPSNASPTRGPDALVPTVQWNRFSPGR